MNQNKTDLKRKIAKYSIKKLPTKGVVALGSGSTVNELIKEISSVDSNLEFLSASSGTSQMLREYNLKEIKQTSNNRNVSNLVCFDGADEVVFPKLNFTEQPISITKGHGAALVREKILWEISNIIYVLADHSKINTQALKAIPVEIVRYGGEWTKSQIKEISDKLEVRNRTLGDGQPLITDNSNLIVDIMNPNDFDLNDLDQKLQAIPGVVGTGLFLSKYISKSKFIIGYPESIREFPEL